MAWYYISALMLIIGGCLAAASLIAAKNQQAGDAIKKLAPYQSWIGIVLLIYGIWRLIDLLLHISAWSFLLRLLPVLSVIYLVSVILFLLLGLLLSMSFLKQKSSLPQQKLEDIDKKLRKFQIPLGVAGIICRLLLIITAIVGF